VGYATSIEEYPERFNTHVDEPDSGVHFSANEPEFRATVNFESRLLKSNTQTLYGFLCIRLCGTRCAGRRRAHVFRR
jgi:hypothetical protein